MSDPRLNTVERACIELANDGEPVTFISVAARAGVPRVSLYRNPALRAVVEEHRSRAREASTLSGLAAEIANQRFALEALAERVRHHEEVLRKLTKKR
jgi:hypothetical protein